MLLRWGEKKQPTYTLSPITMEVENYPNWKETNLGGTPMFHWTMIMGGRVSVKNGATTFWWHLFFLTQPMDPEKKSLNFIFPTKYVIPKSLKFGHWLSEFCCHHQTLTDPKNISCNCIQKESKSSSSGRTVTFKHWKTSETPPNTSLLPH